MGLFTCFPLKYMKIIKKTKKYNYVRLSCEELNLLEKAIEKDKLKKIEEEKVLKYAEWFFSNHVEIHWQDEYSSWQSTWYNIHTKQPASDPGIQYNIYKIRFRDIIKKNGEAYNKKYNIKQ